MKGMIKFYNKDKGFGFVVSEDNQEYYFKDRAIAFGDMPEKGRQCEFTPNPNTKPNSNKKPEIETLKVLTQVAATTAPKKQHYRDDRVTCPHCNRKMVPRIYYLNHAPYKSNCPFCGGQIEKFQSDSANFLGFFYILALIILVPFALIFGAGMLADSPLFALSIVALVGIIFFVFQKKSTKKPA